MRRLGSGATVRRVIVSAAVVLVMAVALVCSGLAGTPARASSPGAGLGQLVNVSSKDLPTVTVGSVHLDGPLLAAGLPRLGHVRTGSFSGTFEPCTGSTCGAGGIVGTVVFGTTPVPLRGSVLPGGSITGSCQGGQLDFIADGAELSTTCDASIAGKSTGAFAVIVDTPLPPGLEVSQFRTPNSVVGDFCTDPGLTVGACAYDETVSGLASGIFP